jgi:multidrug resistance efflux pump
VAQDSLESARTYQRLTEEAARGLEGSAAASQNYRLEILRERASAHKAVVSQEAEIAESITQLADLDGLSQQIRQSLDDVKHDFADGRISAPTAGIISTNLAHTGQSLAAGTPIAEVLDPTDIFVDWYIPNERLADPKVGEGVVVLFGNRRIAGKIADILPVSAVYAGTVPLFGRDRPATQIARIRFDSAALAPALNSTVYVHMFYSRLGALVAGGLISLFGQNY